MCHSVCVLLFASKVRSPGKPAAIAEPDEHVKICKYTGFKSTDLDPVYKSPVSNDETPLSSYKKNAIKWSAYIDGEPSGKCSALALRVIRKYYSWMSPPRVYESFQDPAFKAEFENKVKFAIELHKLETRPSMTQFGKPQLQNVICSWGRNNMASTGETFELVIRTHT